MKKLTREQVEAIRSLPLGDMPNKLAVVRRMLDIVQEDLAAAAGVSQNTISDAEAGKPIKLPTAQAIVVALGAGVDDIFPATVAA